MIGRRRLIKTAVKAAGVAWMMPRALATPLHSLLENQSHDLGQWDVRRFGAKGDGKTLDTPAVQAAIDACYKDGGGDVVFPARLTFLIGTIYLKDHVTLFLDQNSTILGSDNLIDYAGDVGISPFYPEPLDPCLIYAKAAVDIGIAGKGKIVGHTQNRFNPVQGTHGRATEQRPMLIRFEQCSQISIVDVSLQRCGSWCVHLKRSQDIFLRNLRIYNERQDGFDLESCQNVSISDCHLECGDDAIAVTTSSSDHPARNITITNCLFRSRWAGIRFGPLSKGNFEDIAVSNCIFYDCNGGGIKLGMFEGAEIRNCLFDNLIMNQVSAPISMFVCTWPEIGSVQPNPPMMPVGKIHDLQFRGIQVVVKAGLPDPRPDQDSAMFFQGHPQGLIENILLQDLNVIFPGGGTLEDASRRNIVDMNEIDIRKGGYWTDDKTTWGIPPAYGLYARHIKGFVLENVTFRLAGPDWRSAIFCSDSEDIRIGSLEAASGSVDEAIVTLRNCADVRLSEIETQQKATTLVRVEGAGSDRIVVASNDWRMFATPFVCADGADSKSVLLSGR